MAEENKSDAAVCDIDSVEERREERAHRRWLAKAGFLTFCAVIAASVFTLIYAAVIQDKDFETGFIGQTLSTLFEVLKLLL
jgi:hypothetical protein